MVSRREFLGTLAAGAASLAVTSSTAKSYAQILGANDRVNFAVIGLNGRGRAHLGAIKANEKLANLAYACDVDSQVLNKFVSAAQKELGYLPSKQQDFRRALESKDVDVITIATPDHWHAPMAIMGLQAGKHVYDEKPTSHNPREGELLLQAQKKYGKLVQAGSQQRSSPHTIEIIRKIHEGLIGKTYFGKAWYCNVRKSMGTGKVTAPPDHLDWDLWQGPAPRRPYKDNIHPYNWHWLWHYGTGESLNNGTHEVDLCRWALRVDYPKTVSASGGRYHFRDDWEFYDTLVTSFTYDDNMITWEGLSCQGKQYYGRERGVTIHGTEGTVLIDRNGYEVFDMDNKKIDEFQTGEKNTTRDVASRDSMTNAHFLNMINAIRVGEKLRAPIEVANIAVTMLQLSNIAWKTNRALDINKDAHILNDQQAMQLWSREYEKGWEVRI
jgi:predicted dehydrogenase